MTEYDLETKKALRRVSLLEYGFRAGDSVGTQDLPGLRQGQRRYRTDCISCGAALPKGDPLMTSTEPAIAAVPAAVWWSRRCGVLSRMWDAAV